MEFFVLRLFSRWGAQMFITCNDVNGVNRLQFYISTDVLRFQLFSRCNAMCNNPATNNTNFDFYTMTMNGNKTTTWNSKEHLQIYFGSTSSFFIGILLYGNNSKGITVGAFNPNQNDTVQIGPCITPYSNSGSLTHQDPSQKAQIIQVWQPPTPGIGQITFTSIYIMSRDKNAKCVWGYVSFTLKESQEEISNA